jgi:hypothetical protein
MAISNPRCTDAPDAQLGDTIIAKKLAEKPVKVERPVRNQKGQITAEEAAKALLAIAPAGFLLLRKSKPRMPPKKLLRTAPI